MSSTEPLADLSDEMAIVEDEGRMVLGKKKSLPRS
jgi:hypothetical protein